MHEDEDYEKLATPTELKKWAKQNSLMYGGLIAIGVVILQGFLTADPLSVSGKISVVAFAISLPLLAVLIMLDELQSGDQAVSRSITDETAKALALLSSLVGVVAAFWHIDWFAGVAVIAAGIVALGVYGAHFSGSTFTQAALRRRQQRAERQSATQQRAAQQTATQVIPVQPTTAQQSPVPPTTTQQPPAPPTTPHQPPEPTEPPVQPTTPLEPPQQQ
ncbi:hypothetical protein OG874_08545 [Nocardia sp. NBC_00565]|uniref:hypothetical protein n=1 Tax=Nocardia sp. NBC_00565 TaxID=2975993 RepID=UPI002E7FF13F|nr:hypothetical protein [Nocardia sp. NBC_00565]WUC05179.1 hypothetical protein OG874_08545 [Nocardia sp. NBC_00565]